SRFGTGVCYCCSSYSSSRHARICMRWKQRVESPTVAMIPPPAKPPDASLSTGSYLEG
ncbi:hypothetical protein A2U01_0099741, partial [Trifolium medium]|nr:hypothetical protein [Trifolium medium]